MKKTYDSPKFETIKLTMIDVLNASKTEDGGGGVDWGGEGEFPGGNSPEDDF